MKVSERIASTQLPQQAPQNINRVLEDTLQATAPARGGSGAAYAPLLTMPAHLRPPAVGVPKGNVSIKDGNFHADGCCLLNPTCWPLVTLCFGSWVLSLPSQSTN